MISSFENLLRTFRRRLSRNELVISLLRLPVSKGTSSAPGLIMIQIDGLSRKQMEHARADGRLPFLSRLITRENYETRTFYSGLPASTPAVQAELFFGARDVVPAFSFLNRRAKRVFSMFDSDSARKVENEIKRQGEGLLREGSSWSNIYSGGASTDESHFCASRLGVGDVFRSRRIIQALTFPILHFPSLIRLVALSFLELVVAVWDLCRGVYRGESLLMEARTLVSRVIVCIVLREILTIGLKIDVARGLPVIHANFLGYDEQAHRRGPSSAFAHWSLRGIDNAIGQIYHAARRSARRDYQIWVYSDHGQEKTYLFTQAGRHLDEVIRNSLDGFNSRAQPVVRRPRYPFRSAYLLRKSGDRIVEGYQGDASGQVEEPWFSIAAMGPVGHLYLIHPQARDQKIKLAERLVRENRVRGALVTNGSGKFEWLFDDKRLTLPEDAVPFLPHPGSLKNEVARDLVHLCKQKCAGDIVLLGWSPNAATVSFVDEHGSHAGPGLEETQGFVLLPPATRLPDRAKEYLRPYDVRTAALHYLGRQLLPPGAMPRRSPTRHFRVMTYNVRGCRGMDGRTSAARIARLIGQFHPDLVALQELDFGRVRSERHDQPNLIASALGMHVHFCPTVVDENEQYGHALLSRWPMEIVRTAIFERGARRRQVEPRGALWVRLEIDGVRVNLMNTHFGLGRKERNLQTNELLSENWIGKLRGEPLILCGDFNMAPGSKSYRDIKRQMHDVQQSVLHSQPSNTYSTFHPFIRIDHIFISRHLAVDSVVVPRNDLTRVASDHLPLIADLHFRAA
jgi:endonuclease/exonuclease/phosphatase family metal-dependent hydrolase